MNADRTIPATLMGVFALITYRDIKKTGTLPKPHGYLSAATVYSMLFLLASVGPELASAMSVGLLIGVAMVPGILSPDQWKPVGFTLPKDSSIGTMGPNGVSQPGTKGLQPSSGGVGGLTVPPGSPPTGGGTIPKPQSNGPGWGALTIPYNG